MIIYIGTSNSIITLKNATTLRIFTMRLINLESTYSDFPIIIGVRLSIIRHTDLAEACSGPEG
jgi:hypothetical protein